MQEENSRLDAPTRHTLVETALEEAERLNHLVGNLLDNALKYSPSTAPIQVSVRALDSALQIQVADRGIGIPREDLARVFDKFFSVQRPDKIRQLVPVETRRAKFDKVFRVRRPEKMSGIGLGLSICKGIIEAHGGTIITLRLPLSQEQSK
ncbi:MAG: sensor histidine kinase [Chloroflexota bacterium]